MEAVRHPHLVKWQAFHARAAVPEVGPGDPAQGQESAQGLPVLGRAAPRC